jgi:tetratricopeptide (TPR) repeat protein
MEPFMRAASERAAIALIDAGNLKGAEARIRQMLASNGNDARALALLSFCRLSEDDKKEALKIARSAAAIDPDDYLVRRTLANALLSNDKYKEAEEVTRSLAADDPQDSNSLFKLAVARSGQKDHLGARQLFDEAEERAGDDVWDLLNLARLRLHEWNYASATALARRALAIDPTRGEIFHILGECALAAKAHGEAYDLALEALRLEPGDKETLRLLARARARRNVLLRPFLPGIDWIVEMDRRGLVIVPVLLTIIFAMLGLSVIYDLARIEMGRQPAVILSLALGVIFTYAVVSYATAVSTRMQIRKDLKKIALPRF